MINLSEYRSRSRKALWQRKARFALQFVLAAVFASCFAATGVNAQSFNYDANPPKKFAFAASAVKPGAFPKPSQCVAAYGLACYTPALMHEVYEIPSNLDGSGQTIVIVDAYGSPTVREDLHTFDQIFGLSDPTLNIIYPGGSPVYNPRQDHNETSWASKPALTCSGHTRSRLVRRLIWSLPRTTAETC
jgi:hypothetical protein